jgi:hypothetical protein
MITEYRPATYGRIQPHCAVTRPQVAVDPDNSFTKWLAGSTLHSIPSYVKELSDWEGTIEFSVNGHDCLTTIRSVSVVDECRDTFDLALCRGMWWYPNNPNGVLDIGDGTAIPDYLHQAAHSSGMPTSCCQVRRTLHNGY